MKTVTALLSSFFILSLVGCSNMAPEEQSMLSGSALGAVGGAALGSLSGHAGEGALIGAGIGAVGGAMQESNRQHQHQGGPRHSSDVYEEKVCNDDYCEIRQYRYN